MAQHVVGSALVGPEAPAGTVAPVTTAVAFELCRALLVGAGGTATIVDQSGATRTNVPLQTGYNPIQCTKVTLGTASDVWALY